MSVGPLIGASVSAMAGFRWVFIVTAVIVLINLWQVALMQRTFGTDNILATRE